MAIQEAQNETLKISIEKIKRLDEVSHQTLYAVINAHPQLENEWIDWMKEKMFLENF